MRFAVFASGTGSNFEVIAKAVETGQIKGELVFLFCDVKSAPVLKKAHSLGIKAITFSPKDFSSKKEYEQQLLLELQQHQIDRIVLAGYMRIIGSTLLEAFPMKIINIHPSLLPDFPGLNGIEQAFNAKVPETGVTIHYIDQGVDTGPMIAQEKIPILKNDTIETLEEKIHAVEHRLYPAILAKIMTND